MYTYRATLVRVVDGDTVDVNVDLGFRIVQTMRLRLNGIDTPELRGAERARGLEAKEYVVRELSNAQNIGVKTYKIGKYGRYVADVYYAHERMSPEEVFELGVCLNQRLLQEGLARQI